MITKGTEEYKKAQQMAEQIEIAAKQTRYNNFMFEVYSESMARFLMKIMDLDCFAAQVAKTIYDKPHCGFQVACVSSKQSWILACAAVENGIDFETKNPYVKLS